MGKWIWINAALLLSSIVCMYLRFRELYQPDWYVYLMATLFWLMMYALGHYIYVYKMKRQTKSKTIAASVSASISQVAQKSARPKVMLKKEKPKVELRKKK